MIICENCNEKMNLIEEDSRQEWYEAIYSCLKCTSKKIHRKEFDQNGIIIKDKIEDKE